MSETPSCIYGTGLTCPDSIDFVSSIARYVNGDTFFGYNENFVGSDDMGQVIAAALPTTKRDDLAK